MSINGLYFDIWTALVAYLLWLENQIKDYKDKV